MFSIGDKVMVKKEYECYACMGKIMIVIAIDNDSVFPITCAIVGGDKEIFDEKALMALSDRQYFSSEIKMRNVILADNNVVHQVKGSFNLLINSASYSVTGLNS